VGNSFQAFWARLARVRIVTDVPKRDVKAYWAASPTVRQRVLDVMAQTGVRAIVAPHKGRPGGRWQRLGDTDFYVIMLDDPARGAAGGARSREGGRSWTATRASAGPRSSPGP
jgi:hypothetical protein